MRTALAGLLLTLLAQLGETPNSAADPERPHPHQGSVEPFVGAPPRLELSEDESAALARGGAVMKQIESKSGGRGVAIQDIHAAPDTVWARIRDFRAYPRMVPHMKECEPYVEDGGDVRVRMVLRVMGLRYEYFISHEFRDDEHWVTWTLDYSRLSDLDDSVGFWLVEPHPVEPGWSRLYYSVDMRTRGWMPGFVRRLVASQGLRDATGWVKREAEAEQAKHDE